MTDQDYARQSKLWLMFFIFLLVLDCGFACLATLTSGTVNIVAFVLLGVSILLSICTSIYRFLIVCKWNNQKTKEIIIEESKKEKQGK